MHLCTGIFLQLEKYREDVGTLTVRAIVFSAPLQCVQKPGIIMASFGDEDMYVTLLLSEH